jgi:carbon storage regulator
MLSLTRGVDESIRIGDSVRLTVCSKLRGHVELALVAPAHLRVIDDANTVLQPMRWECQRTRKRYRITVMVGDSIQIGDDVVVSVGACVHGDLAAITRSRQVRLGIYAPREVPVHREEVYWRIKRGEAWPRRECH